MFYLDAVRISLVAPSVDGSSTADCASGNVDNFPINADPFN